MVYWIACYKDGSTITQDQGKGFDELDRNNLEAFALMFEDKPILTIWLDGNKQLIWRLRREMKFQFGEIRVHLAGWREKIGNEIQQTLCYVFEQYEQDEKKPNYMQEIFPIIHISGKFDKERNRFMNQPHFHYHEAFPGETYYTSKRVVNEDGSVEYIEEAHVKE